MSVSNCAGTGAATPNICVTQRLIRSKNMIYVITGKTILASGKTVIYFIKNNALEHHLQSLGKLT